MRDAVIACSDAAKLFELSDGPLDPVAQLIDGRIERPLSWHTSALRDYGASAAILNMVEDGMTVIGAVGDDMACGQTAQERDSRTVVTGITTGQDEAHWPTERIDCNVPLAGQSTSGAPQSLVADPPFWPVAA